MALKTSYLLLNTDKPIAESPAKLRGYIANKFSEYSVLHHHLKGVGYLYTYPRIQYKVIGGTAFILGIEEGAKVLKDISGEINTLILGSNVYKVEQKVFYEREEEITHVRKPLHYKFITPWLSLNPKNYEKYREIKNWKEKKVLLNSILIGNVLSMCKGLGIVVEKEIYAHTHLDAEKVEFKSTHVVGFTGEFKINFKIPDYFGLGKGVSQGFGVVMNAPRS